MSKIMDGISPRAEQTALALSSYGQADEDGVMCIVSRQAVHEAIDILKEQEAAIAELVEALEWLVAWKEPIEIIAPQLGGTLKAIYHAETLIAKHKGAS